jgi:hypothetical protein
LILHADNARPIRPGVLCDLLSRIRCLDYPILYTHQIWYHQIFPIRQFQKQAPRTTF